MTLVLWEFRGLTPHAGATLVVVLATQLNFERTLSLLPELAEGTGLGFDKFSPREP